MSAPRDIFVLFAVALTGILGVLLSKDDAKPVGGLSHAEVIEIRDVVIQSQVPGWSSFTRTNLRMWPAFLRMRWGFRIVEIEEDPIGTPMIRPDGTVEESKRPVTVWFTAGGKTQKTCRVEWKNGRWIIVPLRERTLFMFVAPSNQWSGPATRLDSGD